MNSNPFDFANDNSQIEREIQELTNIGWNGRFFIASLVAIALAVHRPFLALLCASIFGISVLVEQIPGIVGTLLRLFVYGMSAGFAIALAAFIWLSA